VQAIPSFDIDPATTKMGKADTSIFKFGFQFKGIATAPGNGINKAIARTDDFPNFFSCLFMWNFIVRNILIANAC